MSSFEGYEGLVHCFLSFSTDQLKKSFYVISFMLFRNAESLFKKPTELDQLTQECRTRVPPATKTKNCHNDEEWSNAQSNYSIHLLPRDTATLSLQAIIEFNEKS